jgi:hypothetical protein
MMKRTQERIDSEVPTGGGRIGFHAERARESAAATF